MQQKTSGTPISSPLLQEKAKRFHHQLHAETAAYAGRATMNHSKLQQNGYRRMEIQNNVEAVQLMQLHRMMNYWSLRQSDLLHHFNGV